MHVGSRGFKSLQVHQFHWSVAQLVERAAVNRVVARSNRARPAIFKDNLMGRYEAHLTFNKEDARAVESVGDQENWVFSVISGCPILGQGTYCYLTNYDISGRTLKARMDYVASLCKAKGAVPLRTKIERIVYDSKTNVNELEAE